MEGKLQIVAFDDDPETLDWIDRGAIAATIAQKPYVMSYYGLKFLDDLHHNAIHRFKDWRTALAVPMLTFALYPIRCRCHRSASISIRSRYNSSLL